MTNRYVELQERHQEEFKEFPIFFAFSQEQLKEGLKKLGLTEKDTDQLYRLNGSGFYRKSDDSKLQEMWKRHELEMMQALKGDTTGEHFVRDMFSYELANREYGYTRELEDTLEALDLTIEDVNALPNLRNGLDLALKAYQE